MSKFINGLVDATNYAYTENMAITHKTTKSDLLDMFAMGAAMRTRTEEDIILMFSKAYKENPVYALKCLYYIGDCRGGQGERRFFRICMRWLAKYQTEAARRNLQYIPFFRRWDDLYVFVDTPLEAEAFGFMKNQLALDVQCKSPSLLAKWLKSENTSSKESRKLANKTREYFGMNHKQYRKTLSILRERINVLERLMSAGKWDEIEFDKIPSRAGMIYRNAFARHDIERMKQDPKIQSYADFAKDTTKKVNAKVLYPYECVDKALKIMGRGYRIYTPIDDTERLMVNKYWDNLADYFNNATFNGMAIVDTSGSMCSSAADAPINVALSLGLYCAEKAKGPFSGYFMSFSSKPELIKVEGVDFCDKIHRMARADWGMNTNVEAAFDLMLNTAIKNKCTQDEIPQNLIIISDMEFDACATSGPATYSTRYYWQSSEGPTPTATLFEQMEKKWNAYGYKMPVLTFWNVRAHQNNIAMSVKDGVQYVSGMSPSIFKQVMENKNAFDLMYEVLDADRYAVIQ